MSKENYTGIGPENGLNRFGRDLRRLGAAALVFMVGLGGHSLKDFLEKSYTVSDIREVQNGLKPDDLMPIGVKSEAMIIGGSQLPPRVEMELSVMPGSKTNQDLYKKGIDENGIKAVVQWDRKTTVRAMLGSDPIKLTSRTNPKQIDKTGTSMYLVEGQKDVDLGFAVPYEMMKNVVNGTTLQLVQYLEAGVVTDLEAFNFESGKIERKATILSYKVVKDETGVWALKRAEEDQDPTLG